MTTATENRVLAAARRWHELTHDKVCSFLVHSGSNVSWGVSAYDKLCKACAADAAARKRRVRK